MESSTLSPKIQRKSMFNAKCSQPPCMNIEVSTVVQAGMTTSSERSSTSPKMRAGTIPNWKTAICPCSSPRETCQRKARTQMPIIDQVTIGVRMRGLSSEMGNMRLSPHRSPGENTLGIWPCEAHSLKSSPFYSGA